MEDDVLEAIPAVVVTTFRPDNSDELTAEKKREISVDLFCEFLPVAFHQILYARRLYPLEIFAKRKKYGIAVYKSCHPGLNMYIDEIVDCIKPLLGQGAIRRVDLCVLKELVVLERFLFEVGQLKAADRSDDFLTKVELSLRDTLLKISTCDGVLTSLPEGCTFEVQVHVLGGVSSSELRRSKEDSLKWIQADEEEERENETLVPLKSVTRSPFLQMQLLVAEAKDLK